ncbi:MAG: S8 family serine peptidase [Phycisphaerales bacterium]|nr:S8 family serine peptidase [Phycisphaerales bacterium]
MSTRASILSFQRIALTALAAGLLLAAMPAPALAGDGSTQGLLKWRSGAVVTPQQDVASLAQAVDATRSTGARVVIQLDRPLTDQQSQRLEAAGVRLLNYVGDNAYFASFNPSRATGASVAQVGGVRCVLPIARDWKLHPDIVVDQYPDFAFVSEDKEIETGEPLRVAAYILLHPDADLAEGANLVQQYGGEIISAIGIVNGLVVTLPVDAVKPLAEEDLVQWIEPPLPKFSELNNSNRAITGVDIVQAPPYGLDGTGVGVLVYDGGKIRATHQDLTGRVTIGPNDASSTSDHATHVAGTIGGTGAASGGLRKGMAPNVQIISFGFEQAGGLSQGFLYTNPGDIVQDYGWAIANGAHVANNSIGTNTSTNNFPCSWQGDYGFTDTIIDAIVRGTGTDPNLPQFNTPFRVVWANGNERQSTRCADPSVPAGYHLTAPPACAKNHLTVGALNSNNDTMTTFSSWGPADDDRMKPDMCAPGCQSNDDNGVTSCGSASDTTYTSKCGTSMASPTTCGIAALMLQDFRANYPGQPDFRNSTLRAILAHTAQDLGNVGPDYQYGYGSIRVQPAIDLIRAGNFIENVIPGTGATFQAIVLVGAGEQVKVTIAWDDPPGTPNVSPALVNDLDLRVYDAQNNVYLPWTLGGLANPAAPAVRTQPNRVDNIEQVLIDAPAPGAYRIEVFGFNVAQGPQSFSLVATPQLVNCSSAGTASLDRNTYACASTAGLRVIDCDLNTSDLIIDSVTVNLASTSNPSGLSVVLFESAPESATFLASVVLSTTPGPGELLIAPGDTVTITYNDADNGSGQPAIVTDTALIDCTAPLISNVAVAPINPRDATITFNTDEPAQATIRYGESCANTEFSVTAPGLRTSHSIKISGLQDDVTYYFEIDVVDAAGNTATDDNGGSCYSFTTPEVPDFFTEQFVAGDENDLDYISLIWTLSGTYDFYDLCNDTPITQLPNDPNEGLVFSSPHTDDSFRTITLTGGAQVQLYGVSYPQVHVGSNGYLTFTAGDSTLTETLAAHFNRPRISALFDDLNPTQGGRVTYQQLPDRLVVSFVNVPEHNVTGSVNTFQYELFYNGEIRIHYLLVSAADGIAGLSAGNGLSPDFYESNLNTYGGCAPGFTLTATPASATLCAPTNSLHTIAVGIVEGFTDPVTLTAMNVPAGINASFSVNPVIPGNSSALTFDVTGAVAPGDYTIQVQGVSGELTKNVSIGLRIATAVPATPVLSSPANGATNQPLRPTFAWNAAAQAVTYAIQVATDAGFSNIVASATGLTTASWQPSVDLTHNTTHYWRVRGTNICGDGNWSAPYSFMTLFVPDYFTELFTTSKLNDIDDVSLNWTPDGSPSFYTLCKDPLDGPLPTDPNTGAALAFTATNQFRQIDLTGGATVKLYGVEYSTVYVGSNGYLTFTAGDTASAETIAAHFNRPRVSGLFDSLSPHLAGAQATWEQFADRLVVSFVNVRELSTSPVPNTFQYELFFDGTIRIHYKTIGATDGLIGLSLGGGTPTYFAESDLSSYGACGPRPPKANSQEVQTPANVNLNVTLTAQDDGLPDPPASLTFKIESLPTNGRLFDPGFGQITSVPHTLVSGGALVTYDPDHNYQGLDGFTFRANDGGTPPEGGDSNLATVSIMVGGPQPIYTFPLDTNPGWSVENQWAFGQPAGLGGDPSSGFTGSNVFGFNLSGAYPNNMPTTYYLTTGPLDFSGVSQVSLRFRRWLGVERSQYDYATIDVSGNNGGSWTNVWTNPQPAGTSIVETAWSYQVYDLSAHADGQTQVRIRWGMGPTDSSVTYSGWNLDDIEFWAIVPLGPSGCPGDLNCDGVVNFDDIDLFVEALGYAGGIGWPHDCPWINADCDGDANVTFDDIDPFVALIGTSCP